MDGYTRKERLFENNVKQITYSDNLRKNMYVVRMHHDKIVVIDSWVEHITDIEEHVIKSVYKRTTYVIYHNPYRVVKIDGKFITTSYFVPTRLLRILEIRNFYPSDIAIEFVLAPNLLELMVDDDYNSLCIPYLYKYEELCRGRLKKGLKQLFGVAGPSALEQLKLILRGAGHVYHTHVSLKGLVPWDIQLHLARRVATIISEEYRVLFTKVSKNMLLRIGSEDYNRSIVDTYGMYKKLWKSKYKRRVRAILSRAKTWKQLHDELSDFQRKMTVKNVVYKIPHHEFLFKYLNSVDFMGHTIRPPKDLYEVYKWGQEQQHCIAIYATEHGNDVLLFGVYKNEELVYNIMITTVNYRTMQFYGKFNKTPPEDLEMAFRHVMSLVEKKPVKGG